MTERTDRRTRGLQILAKVQSHPLTVEGSLRDYVFYFVPRSDVYGEEARIFFQTYYPRHRAFEVTSFEALFKKLAKDIARSGNTRIREIVIVTHSNSWGINAPLTHKDFIELPSDKHYTDAESIAILQREIVAHYRDFQRSRDVVLPRLGDASWVTVRSCNFGFSSEGMFALYALFGGRANLYALRGYMTFVSIPIDPRYRLPTVDAAHEYLRKQGLVPRNRVSDSQKSATVGALLNKNRGRLPIQFFIADQHVYDLHEGLLAPIASTHPNGEASPASRSSYEDLVRELDSLQTRTLRKVLEAESDEFRFDGPGILSKLPRNRWGLKVKRHGRTGNYTIRERFLRQQDASVRRELGLFERVSKDTKLSSIPPWDQYGEPYDVPGTELQAYFDGFSIDDLTCFQDAVRATYQPTRVILIEHAQRSIERRRDFLKWFVSTPCAGFLVRDPLFGPDDEESCYWSPFPPRGLKDAEKSDLEAAAHVSHNGFQMWASAKVDLDPLLRFRRDLFLEWPLPSGVKVASDQRQPDIVTTDDRATPAERSRRGPRGERAKDEPAYDRRVTGPRKPDLTNLSDQDLVEALDEILARRQVTWELSAQLQRKIEVGFLALDVLVAAIGEVEAWAPTSIIGVLSKSRGFFAAANVTYATIVSPLVGWVLLTVEMRRATEAHRMAGMRAAVEQAKTALIWLSFKLRRGQEISNLTIPAVTQAGNIKRRVELDRYVATARQAVEFEHYGFIHEKFLAGYDLVIEEVAKLANEAVRATDELVRSRFKDLGLSTRQVDVVLSSGVIDMKQVYAVTFEGLARMLQQNLDRFTK